VIVVVRVGVVDFARLANRDIIGRAGKRDDLTDSPVDVDSYNWRSRTTSTLIEIQSASRVDVYDRTGVYRLTQDRVRRTVANPTASAVEAQRCRTR
jgi:hypothetical protein